MKQIKTFLLVLLPAFFSIIACQGQGGYAFKGDLAGAANLDVALEQAHFDRSNVEVGKVKADANGQYAVVWRSSMVIRADPYLIAYDRSVGAMS